MLLQYSFLEDYKITGTQTDNIVFAPFAIYEVCGSSPCFCFPCVKGFIKISSPLFPGSRRTSPIYAFYFTHWKNQTYKIMYLWANDIHVTMYVTWYQSPWWDIREIIQIKLRIQKRVWFAFMYLFKLFWCLIQLDFAFKKKLPQTSKYAVSIGFHEFSCQYLRCLWP